jgi:membrane protein YdbS with pleckstrin-like domain
MKKILFANWHFMRFFRIAVSVFCFYIAYEQHQWVFVAFGIFFLFQAVFNLGCGPNGCNVTPKKSNNE